MMDFNIIDAHSHLWLRQNTEVNGLPIRTLTNGRSLFMGEERQMVPPFMIDGRNSAEVFLSNMDYAQVSAAVVTQEFIDGIQNDTSQSRPINTRTVSLYAVCANFVTRLSATGQGINKFWFQSNKNPSTPPFSKRRKSHAEL